MKTPPQVKKFAKKIVQHDCERVDYYAWLRDDNWKNFIKGDLTFNNPEILDYINAENAWTDHRMNDSEEIIQTIYDEFMSMERNEDSSYPTQHWDYDYYSRSRKEDNYVTFYRKKRTPGTAEEAFFDINKEAEGKPLYSFGPSDVSSDNHFFAYTYNLTGSLEKTLKVRNLDTGKDLDWEISEITDTWLWVDNEHLYIVERDQYSRGKYVYKINIHQGPSSKTLIFTKPEEYSNMFLSLETTNDKKYFLIHLSSQATQVSYLSQAGTDQFSFLSRVTTISLTLSNTITAYSTSTQTGENTTITVS